MTNNMYVHHDRRDRLRLSSALAEYLDAKNTTVTLSVAYDPYVYDTLYISTDDVSLSTINTYKLTFEASRNMASVRSVVGNGNVPRNVRYYYAGSVAVSGSRLDVV